MSEQKKQENYWLATLENNKKTIESIMPPIVEDKEKFFANTTLAIKRNPDLMKYTFDKQSCLLLVVEIEKLARLGLSIGGVRPQAYIIPFGNRPTAIPTADGYKFMVTSGANAIFSDIRLHHIYKGDSFTLDESNGIFEKIQTTADCFETEKEDNFVGIVFVGTKKNGDKIVQKVTKTEIEHHRRFSPQKEGSMWKNHYMRMAEKTAIKHILRDFVYVCEGIATIEEFESNQVKESVNEKTKKIKTDSFEIPASVIVESEIVEEKKEVDNLGQLL
jgi:phage RecT family recombinase